MESNPLLAALGMAEQRVAEVIRILRERAETVACAESLTAGLVCAALTCIPGSSAVVRGGFVVYATDLKTTLAGVSAPLLAEHGAVYPDVAIQLATGVRERCGASWGLGLTGVAGPDPQGRVSPGRVFIAVQGPREIADQHVRTLDIAGDRHTIRAQAVKAVLDLLHTALNNTG